ncbi:MAG: GNAT family N-acetyltransferase [Methanosphaera stadtmanae]|nr:GNAT family N-acetyltransferase [Methanosphaera stadtmanae]
MLENKIIIIMIKRNYLDYGKLEVHEFSKKLMDKIDFDSGDYDLNEFLYHESLDYCKSNLAVIYLVFYDNKLIAFFSLSSDSIKINNKLNIKLKYYPSMKIGRLAVDKEYQSYGIGTWIIDWIIGFVMDVRWSHGI